VKTKIRSAVTSLASLQDVKRLRHVETAVVAVSAPIQSKATPDAEAVVGVGLDAQRVVPEASLAQRTADASTRVFRE
jgi:hypothetical protein